MTYLILPDEYSSTDSGPEALMILRDMRKNYPGAVLAEIVIGPDDPATKVPTPAELDQAITLWNEKIGGKNRLKFYKPTIRQRGIYVAPFMKWRKAVGRRDYFLGQCVEDILTATDFLQSFIRFGLLFEQVKGGEWHSDLLRAGHYKQNGSNGNGNGQISEAAYLQLARRVSEWQRDKANLYVGGGGGDDAFERDIGMSWKAFERIKARFNGVQP